LEVTGNAETGKIWPIMRSVSIIHLVAFVAQAHAEHVVDKLFDRGLDQVLRSSALDGSTLGKPGSAAISPARMTAPAAFVPPSSSAVSRTWASPMAIYQPQLRGPTLSRNVQVNAAIDAKTVKKLRDETGAGMMACKKALVENDGDVVKASEYLRKKGIASADKKAARSTGEGIIATYVHAGSKLGVMVELNCETDFVAKNPEFSDLAKSVAMQIAASPTVTVVSDKDVDQAWIANEKRLLMMSEDMASKPEAIREKMVEGRLKKIAKELVLLDQAYIKEPDMTVEDLVKKSISKFGENIKIARFVRFNVGESPAADEPAPEAEPAAEAAPAV